MFVVSMMIVYILQLKIFFFSFLQIFEGDECNDGDIGEDTFRPVSNLLDVKNFTEIDFFDYTFLEGRPYKMAL